MADEAIQRQVPTIYASGVSLGATGTDLKVVFTDLPPPPEEDGETSGRTAPIRRGIVAMSFHTAKDLHALLGDTLSRWESDFGKLDTPFLRGLRNQNPS